MTHFTVIFPEFCLDFLSHSLVPSCLRDLLTHLYFPFLPSPPRLPLSLFSLTIILFSPWGGDSPEFESPSYAGYLNLPPSSCPLLLHCLHCPGLSFSFGLTPDHLSPPQWVFWSIIFFFCHPPLYHFAVLRLFPPILTSLAIFLLGFVHGDLSPLSLTFS